MRWTALLLVLVGCTGVPGREDRDPGADRDAGSDAHGAGPRDGPLAPGDVFDPVIRDIVIEIDHETGHEPFTGSMLGLGDAFDLSAANLDRLFSGTKNIVLPRTLAAMQDIGTIADEELTASELLALASLHRTTYDTATRKSYYVLFVSGHFVDANGPNPNVLGVALGRTGVIVMFKDVIRGTGVFGAPQVVRYVEQATLVHELAHAIGLVDNGVPMVAPHVDATHRPHCTNDRCVMHWLNEGAHDAVTFVQQQVLTNSSILFDAACLADVDALTGGP